LAPQGTQDCLQKIRALQQPLRVLYVAAHPDDENTRLLAFFSKGRNADVRYLSLTHGEGGQNLMGPEVGTPLGAIRTQELYAARRVDGAQQLFGPCADFGYSKSAVETWQKWDAQTTTAEIVGFIRSFQPHVVIKIGRASCRERV
jgi:LmbE family N-acetylglucosaminyl deacetylase